MTSLSVDLGRLAVVSLEIHLRRQRKLLLKILVGIRIAHRSLV